MNTGRDDPDLLAKRLSDGPLDEEVLQRYHACVSAAGRPADAARVYEKLLAANPRHRALRSLAIAIALQNGDRAGALRHIHKLMALAPPDDTFIDAALTVRQHYDAETAGLPAASPELSLCMITRDEARCLAACLDVVAALVDEIVIVDTGSRDRTQDIARIFGAKVFSLPWGDDFAAARNLSLEKACGRWILVLDADEAIAPRDFSTLRKMMVEHDDGRTAFAVETRNYGNRVNLIGWRVNDGRYKEFEAGRGWIGSTKVRLFPNRPTIRFHFPVHERVEPGLARAGVRVCSCCVPVHHYGHLDEVRNRKKMETYFELGLAKYQQAADDLPALRELAAQAGQLERWEEAVKLWEAVLKLDPSWVEAHVNIAGACWQKGDYERALQAAQAALALEPRHREARFNEAVALLMTGRSAAAVKKLAAVLADHPEHLPTQFMLGAGLRFLQRDNQAQAIFERLRQKMPGAILDLALADLAARLECSSAVRRLDFLGVHQAC